MTWEFPPLTVRCRWTYSPKTFKRGEASCFFENCYYVLPIKGCSLDPAWSSFNSFPGDAFSESASITIIIVIYDLNHQIQLWSIRITIKTWQDQEMLSSLISTMLGGNAEIQVPIWFSFQSDVLIVRYNVFGCYSNHTDMDAIVNVFPQDVRPYSGSDASGGTMYNIDRSDTFGRRRMDIDGEK